MTWESPSKTRSTSRRNLWGECEEERKKIFCASQKKKTTSCMKTSLFLSFKTRVTQNVTQTESGFLLVPRFVARKNFFRTKPQTSRRWTRRCASWFSDFSRLLVFQKKKWIFKCFFLFLMRSCRGARRRQFFTNFFSPSTRSHTSRLHFSRAYLCFSQWLRSASAKTIFK